MVVLSLRNRQNRECVDEDLRANKKVFEREQQQIAIMPQSEMPPNDKLQAIAFQFNKDIENVKNALNDGLTDMNTPDAAQRGFADFSKVSLAWNKLVARVNPYIKGQQTDPDFQAATAGDYNYVRQKLKDDLLQFFANGIQQINSFKQGIAAQGGVARVQNEASLVDIAQQLGTGFYKNVKYGAEARTSLLIPRLPPDVGQQGQPQPPPAQPPPPPPAQPVPVQPFQAQNLTQADIRLFDEYDQIHGQATPITLANAAIVAQTIEDDMFNALPQARQRQISRQQRDGERQRIEALIPEMVQYIAYQQALQQQAQQQAQPAPAPQRPQSPPAPARRGRPVDMNRQQAIFDKANEIGVFQQLTGYANKTQAERQRVAPIVRQLAAELQISPEALKRNLNQMVGFGRSSGGFLGGLIADALGDAYRGTTGKSFGSDLLSLGKMAFNNRGAIGDLAKNKFETMMRNAGNGRGKTSRGRPLRLANNFTGTSVEPNTLADLKNRYRGKSYIGTMTGDIDPTLQNSSVLGSARRRNGRGFFSDMGNSLLGTLGDAANSFRSSSLYDPPQQLKDRMRDAEAFRRGEGRLEGGFITIPSDMLNPDGTRDDWEEIEGSDVTGSVDNYPKSLSQKARELIATQGSRILQAAMNRFIQVATATPQAAMDAARATSAGAAAALPVVIQALQRANTAAAAGASATRDVYQHEATQAVINYVWNHPEVLANYWGLGTGFVVGTATGLVRQYLKRGMRGNGRCCFTSALCNGTKAYRYKRGEKSANARKESVRGRGVSLVGSGNGVDVNVKYAKLPKALQPTEEDLNPTPRPQSSSGGMRRRRMPKESYEGYQDEENDVYTHRGGIQDSMPLLHTEMLQDKALGLLKGMPRRIGVEDPKFKQKQ